MTTTAIVLLSKNQARALTKRIQAAGENFAALLLEAHDGEAWRVLGYATWQDYIAGEFSFTRSRSYQLLNQARIERAIGGPVTAREAHHVSNAFDTPLAQQPSEAVQRALAEQREAAAHPKPAPPPTMPRPFEERAEPSPTVQRLLAEQRSGPAPKPVGKHKGFAPPAEMVARWCDTVEGWAEQMDDSPLTPDFERAMRRLKAAVDVVLS